MTDTRMARADLLTGLVLFALSIAVIYGAWTMERLEVRQVHPLSVPGLTPGLLGIALALTSLILIGKALTSRHARSASQEEAPAESNPGARLRLITAIVLCLGYALGLIGRVPFWLATSTFVTLSIALFEWDRGGMGKQRAVRLAWALFLGLATGLAVSYVFRDLFLVRLP